MLNYNVYLNNDHEKDIFIFCQHLQMMLKHKIPMGSCYPYTFEQAEKVAADGEKLGCWI